MTHASRRGPRTGWAAALAGAALVAFPALALAQQPAAPTHPVTLDEAVQQALQHQPAMIQAQGAVRSAAAGERAALGAYLPTLSANLGSSLASTERFNSATNTSVLGSSDSYNAGASASLELFNGARGAERREAKAQSASATANLNAASYNAVLATKQSFYDVLRAQELIEVAQSQVKTANEGLTAAEQRLRAGSATQSDVLRAQLQLNTANQSLLEAQNQQRTAAYALGRVMGVDGAVEVDSTGALNTAPLALSPEELASTVAAQAPSVTAAEASLNAAAAGVSAARAQFLPSLRLSSGYNWYNQDPRLANGRSSWQMGLGISIPVFDGFQRQASVQRAQVAATTAQAQLADAKLAVNAQLQSALGTLQLDSSRIALAEEAVKASEEDLRVQQARYQAGASTMLDLLTSEQALVTAQTNLVSARYDYQVARSQLEAIAGREL